MSPEPDPDEHDPPPDPRLLARDWITIWQSEMTALAQDREAGEHWACMMRSWADTAQAAITAMATTLDAAGCARPAAPPGAPPAGAPPDSGRDAELDQLRQRVAGLEHRLAGLEGRG